MDTKRVCAQRLAPPGVYRRLYQQVQQLAAEQDSVEICGFRLYVERDNGIAQQTYRQLGMDKTPYRIYETLPVQ
ncbi:MAG: hypothetical protein R3E89_19175 [Thiolinea sp.]